MMLTRNILWIMMIKFCLATRINAFVEPLLQTFKCRNNRSIAIEEFCNGNNDCRDGSDEKTHKGAKDPFATWQSCVNLHASSNLSCMVLRQLICDGSVTCQNLTPCDLKCDSHYKCQNSSRCVPRSTVCNGNACDGCPEDHGWMNGHGFKCKRNGVQCVLPQQLLHDDISDCDGGVDICFSEVDGYSRNEFMNENRLFRDKCFKCFDDSKIVSSSNVCDGIIDCPDLSDECLCSPKKMRPKICRYVTGFQMKPAVSIEERNGRRAKIKKLANCRVGEVACPNESCVQRHSVCDGIQDCDIDEKFKFCRGTINCRDAVKREKLCRCQVSEITCENSYGIACDGRADCPGHSGFVKTRYPEDECEAFCHREKHNFECRNDMPVHELFHTRATIPCRPAPESYKQDVGKKFDQSYQSEHICDGKQDCIMADDEENCPDRFQCDVIKGDFISINRTQTCDGIEDCRGGVDESEELCNLTRFRCPALGGKKVSINSKYVCDFYITCDDESDEMNCSDGRFYCENKEPLFVEKRKMFNGRGDCSDWSDECPTSAIDDADVFSSRYELIGNPVLRGLVWIMGLLSLFGNATVLYLESKKLRENQHLTPIASANRLLILNLAASDIIMGVYLISLGIVGLNMRGTYCSQELFWRSSSTCVMLGVLSVLSSETSVITMIMLTSCRLFAVVKKTWTLTSYRGRV